jgi:hypothetical protein
MARLRELVVMALEAIDAGDVKEATCRLCEAFPIAFNELRKVI